MGYAIEIITPDECEKIRKNLDKELLFDRKANLNGCCIKLLTNSRRVKDSWEDNFYFMDDMIRSHGRVIAYYDFKDMDVNTKIADPAKTKNLETYVKYDPSTKTAILKNIGYYGYVKSIALGVAGDILEDSHKIGSVHGSVIDIDGKGVSIIAPSGTGKTTHGFGLLALERTHIISDDWYFLNLEGGEAMAFSSEKNCYIRDDIGKIWPQYAKLTDIVKLDREGRAVADLRWVLGKEHIRQSATVKTLMLFKRDKSDPTTIKKMGVEEALEYLVANQYCNPHLLLNDARKQRIRREFFKKYLESVETYLVNTTQTPAESQAGIRKILGVSK
ncbi:MAG: hypothetical protein PHH26_05820 [Candidatus Thermoplasmatota archaeon]|nr:hypothetical protein [Candidatus Thermoplasmatota archaeon]